MDDLKKWYRAGLATRMEALKTARRVGVTNAESRESILRISRLLRDTGSLHGFSDVSRVAGSLEYTGEANFNAVLDDLIHELSKATLQEEKSFILVVDDEPSICELLSVLLGGSHREVRSAGSAKEAEALIEETKFSLILLDLVLPDTDGRNFLLKLKETPSTASIPVLMLSAKIGAQPKTECFALGADGYFEKPFEIDTLSVTVSSLLQRTEGALRGARRDSMTGLPNRAAFRETFIRQAAFAERKSESLSVAILDFDRFKWVNDTHGHRMGDEVLRRSAALLTKSLRKSDYLARWGGEEFVVLFPGTDVEGAANAVRKSLENLKQEVFTTEDGKSFPITFSAGVAPVVRGVDIEDSLAEADKCLYLAKAGGRSRVYTPADQGDAKPRSVLLGVENMESLQTISLRLKGGGFHVEPCRNSKEIMLALKKLDFSLAIVDSHLPGQENLELVQSIRSHGNNRHLPVLLLAAAGDENALSRGFELGVDDYIVEPFSPMELLTRVRTLMRRG